MTPRVLIEPARLAGISLLRCQTDERLVDLVRAGNDRAFEAIVDRYRRPLVGYCTRLLSSARAEDAVQQALLNAYGALRRGDQSIELRPWLYRVTHNAALNALRESGWGHERFDPVHGADGESAHETAERRATLRGVLAAVQSLPERQRDAVVLRELEGRTYEQIASELNASGGAVRQLLNRARHTLRAATTALTPTGALVQLPWSQGGPMLERVSEAAANDGLRGGTARAAGALLAGVAVAAGLAEGTRQVAVPGVGRGEVEVGSRTWGGGAELSRPAEVGARNPSPAAPAVRSAPVVRLRPPSPSPAVVRPGGGERREERRVWPRQDRQRGQRPEKPRKDPQRGESAQAPRQKATRKDDPGQARVARHPAPAPPPPAETPKPPKPKDHPHKAH